MERVELADAEPTPCLLESQKVHKETKSAQVVKHHILHPESPYASLTYCWGDQQKGSKAKKISISGPAPQPASPCTGMQHLPPVREPWRWLEKGPKGNKISSIGAAHQPASHSATYILFVPMEVSKRSTISDVSWLRGFTYLAIRCSTHILSAAMQVSWKTKGTTQLYTVCTSLCSTFCKQMWHLLTIVSHGNGKEDSKSKQNTSAWISLWCILKVHADAAPTICSCQSAKVQRETESASVALHVIMVNPGSTFCKQM